jgi:hypothetical protein
MNRRLRRSIGIVAAAAFGLLLGCTGAEPEILYTDWTLVLHRDNENAEVREYLRAYVAVSDADGKDDITRILLIHEDDEFYWELTPENWVSLEFGGDSWFGSPELLFPGLAGIPRGRYTVTAYDAAQSAARDTIFVNLPEPELSEIVFPTITAGEPPVLDATERVILRVYEPGGGILFSRSVPPGPFGVELQDSLREQIGATLYLELELDNGITLVSGPLGNPLTQ